jgi:hypothetical protein
MEAPRARVVHELVGHTPPARWSGLGGAALAVDGVEGLLHGPVKWSNLSHHIQIKILMGLKSNIQPIELFHDLS